MANPIYHSAYTAAQIEALIAHGAPIILNGNWWTWDIAAGEYVDTGETAEGATAYHGLADDFSTSKAYAVGDLVIYDGALKVCVYPHTGAWNADHFAATTVDAEKASLRTVYSLLPSESNSGAKAETELAADGALLKSLVAQIDETENGVTAVNISTLGNKWDGNYTLMSGTFLYFTSTKATVTTLASGSDRSILIPCLPSRTYRIRSGIRGTMRAAAFPSIPTVGSNVARSLAGTATNGTNPVELTLTTGANSAYIFIQFFIEDDVTAYGATLESALDGCRYDPITVTQVALGQTVYSGSLDVTNGVLSVDAHGSDPAVTVQIAPAEIAEKYGNFSVWADTGDVSAVFRCDIGLYIDSKLS